MRRYAPVITSLSILLLIAMGAPAHAAEESLFTIDGQSLLYWLAGILLIAFLWIVQLRTMVKRRTADLQNEIELRREQEVELKMSMDYLTSTHQRLRFNINRMPLGYIVWDADFTVQEWNPAAERIFGWTEEEARGKHASELIVPEAAAEAVDLVWEQLMRGDESASSINQNRSRDGRTLVCSWYNAPLRTADGEVVGALSMVEEITERYEQEQAQRKQFELLSKVFDSINALVYVADLESYELLYVNRFGQEIFGAGWPGRKCFEYLQAGQTEKCPFCTNDKLNLDPAAATPYIWEFQNTVNERWYQCIDRAIPWIDGRRVRMEIAFDITETKQAMQLKEEMVSAVSHEMRTPLTSVLGYVEYLLTHSVSAEETRDHLQTVYSEAQKLEHLIDSFLNLRQLMEGEQPLSLFPVAVPELLEEIRSDLAKECSGHEIALDCPEELACLKGDPVQVREAVYRVASNAVKYSPAGGAVTLRAEQRGEMVEVEICDQGIGIPAEALGKIFDQFYRVDNSDTREFGGVGIGLSLVRDIVTLHGGQVRAQSVEGEGTTITLSFPIYAER